MPGAKQPAAAKLEKRADMYVSNRAQVARRVVARLKPRRYIEATGGTLEITAKFPGATVTITGFAGIGEADAAEQA